MGLFRIGLCWGDAVGEAGGVDKERGLLPVPAHSQSEECEGGLLGAGDEKVGMVWDVVGMGVVGRLRSCVLQGRKRGWRCL